MSALLLVAWQLLRTALQHLLISLITERLLKDVVIVALEKFSKCTKTKVDDKLVYLVKRGLYPDFEAGEPPDVLAPEEKPKK